MGCDYYIQTDLVIEYLDKMGRLSLIYTNRSIKRGYLFKELDNDTETSYKKYKAEIQIIIKNNTYNKILFDNANWVKETYKKNYKADIKRQFREIDNIQKIYKKTTAWERN
jgi:hypothetical protein